MAFVLVVLGLAAAGILAAQLPAGPVVAVALSGAIAGVCASQWWPVIAYKYASYRHGRHALEIRRGVLWRRVINVPRSRIQHSDVSQGPLERLHGLGTLTVYTAGARHARVRLNGLEHSRALTIREQLMQADDDDVV